MVREEERREVKLIFVGNLDAGKTSLFQRIVDGSFEQNHDFLAVDFKIKYRENRDQQVRITYWDTAGQERFNALSANYYKQAYAIFVCYDMTT